MKYIRTGVYLLMFALLTVYVQLGLLSWCDIAGTIPNLLLSASIVCAVLYGLEYGLPVALFYAFVVYHLDPTLLLPFACPTAAVLGWFVSRSNRPKDISVSLLLSVAAVVLGMQLLNAWVFGVYYDLDVFMSSHALSLLIQPICCTILAIPCAYTLRLLLSQTRQRNNYSDRY